VGPSRGLAASQSSSTKTAEPMNQVSLPSVSITFNSKHLISNLDIAQRTAQWLGVSFEPVYMDEEAMASRLEDTIWHSELPTSDVNGMARLAMSEVAHSRGFKVVLTGEGSDEHFGGYADFWSDRFREPDLSWEPSLSERDNLYEAYKKWTSTPTSVVGIFGTAKAPPETTQKMLNYNSTGCQISRLSQVPFASWTDQYTEKAPETVLAEGLDDHVADAIMNKWHPLHASEYIWSKTILGKHILRYIGDNIDMVHHIESRPPFLDHMVTEYANHIPPSLKMKYDTETGAFLEKHILRQAVKPFITEEIYNRRKHPFVGLSKYKENGPLHKVCQRLLTEENVKQVGFLDWDMVQTALDKTFKERDSFAFRHTLAAAQFVVLAQRFQVKTAEPPKDGEPRSKWIRRS
jgi:asparagine synthase (glutamine-hydrolysing)